MLGFAKLIFIAADRLRSAMCTRARLLVFALTCTLSLGANAVVLVDAVSTATGNSSNYSIAHTVGVGGADRYMLVGISVNHNRALNSSVSWTVGATTQNLTLVGNRVVRGRRTAEIWGLASPTEGAGTVGVALSTTGTPDNVTGVMSFTGVGNFAVVNPPLNFFEADGENTTPSVTVCPGGVGGDRCPVANGDLAVSVLSTQGTAGAASATSLTSTYTTITAPSVNTSSSSVSNTSSRTWLHTVPAPGTVDNARKLIVGIGVEDDEEFDTCATPGNMDVTNVTYNGIALAHISGADACTTGFGGNAFFEQRVEMWYLDLDEAGGAATAAGSHNVAVTLAGTVNDINVGALTLLGAAAGAPEQVNTNFDTSVTTILSNIPAGTDGAAIVDLLGVGDAGRTFTPGASQNQAWQVSSASSGATMSSKLGVSAIASDMRQTEASAASTNRWVHSVLRIAPRCIICAELYTEQEGTGNNDGNGGASALGGTGEVVLGWSLPVSRNWAIAGVLLKAAVATRAVIGQVAAFRTDRGTVVQWDTLSEHGTLGFHVRRYATANERFERINRRLLPGLLHSRRGGTYRLRDDGVRVGETHRYDIVEIEADGSRLRHGPYEVTVTDRSTALDASTLDKIALNAVKIDSPDEDGFQRRARKESTASHKRRHAKRTAHKARKHKRAMRRGTQAKIGVTRSGIHFVSATDIADAFGWHPRRVKSLLARTRLRLTHQDSAVATWADHAGAGLYFYAQAIDSLHASENIYWLSAGRGLKMRTRNARKPRAVSGQTFMATTHAEGNRYSLTHLAQDPDSDYWMWDFRFGGIDLPWCGADAGASCYIENYAIASPGVTAGTATLKVRVHGASQTPSATDHNVTVTVNDVVVGELSFDGPVAAIGQFELDTSLLLDGEHEIGISAAPSAEGLSAIYINDFELSYPRKYEASENQLSADSAGHRVITFSGFSSDSIKVFDVSNPRRPRILKNTRIEASDDGTSYSASLRARGKSSPLIALDPRTALSPASLTADRPSRLRTRRNAADWLLITTSDLINSADELATHRRSQGLSAKVVDLEDIYDEFNSGIADPDAIWRFLRFAHRHWQTAPRYVVLAGEGSFDYKNYLGHGDSLIPPLLAPTPRGLFASDNLYADVEGNDSMPEMAIGRLPVIDAIELEQVIAKLIAYEAGSGDWTRAVTFAADPRDNGGDFPTDSDAIATHIPETYLLEHLHVDEFAQPADAHLQLVDSLREGRAFLNFIGHGGFTAIGNFNLLRADQVPALANGDRLPIVTALTCLAGNFGAPGQESIGEVLVLSPDVGAAAIWSASGLSMNDSARLLGDGFYRAVFIDGERTIGDAILSSQSRFVRDGGSGYLLDIYNLIGDPATVMH
ncbi:MAG: hypothetical protein ACI8W7_003314 [Gammaproteobacteria bacterium]